jgi:DNA-binding transcriptional MerR regulator
VAVANDTAPQGVTVDQLARDAGLPVRTIREYQTMKLLPPPERRGRVGFYGDEHRRRLELIARLQRRGYSLAGIKDLLEAWDTGANLHALLGVDIGPAALDETPLRLTRRQLDDRLPGLTATTLRRAERVGLVQAHGRNHYIVRSPALLALVADATAAGVRMTEMMDLVDHLRTELGTLAETIADQIVEHVWDPLSSANRTSDVEALLRRGRVLLLQTVASLLADRLGAALAHHAETAPNREQLRDVLDHIRVGVVSDADGTVRGWNEHVSGRS